MSYAKAKDLPGKGLTAQDFTTIMLVNMNRTAKLFLILLSAIIVLLPGCNGESIKTYTPVQNSGTANYKTFVADKGTPHFSFEYPSTYELRDYKTDSDLKYTSVKMTVSSEEEEKGNIGYLQINVDDKFKFENIARNCRLTGIGIQQGFKFGSVSTDSIYGAPSGDAKLAMNWRIEDYEIFSSADNINNYLLLEKNQVDFGGIEGWEVVFSFTESPLNDPAYKNTPIREKLVPVISRYLYFNYKDMVWEIFLYGAAANDTQNKEDYEHVIKTFKFLD
jgi:hypothetical protein